MAAMRRKKKARAGKKRRPAPKLRKSARPTRKPPRISPADRGGARPAAAYRRHKDAALRRRLKQTRAAQDIGPIPPPADLERKAQAMTSLLFFLRTYFPHRFPLPFCQDHLDAIADLERAVVTGGLHAFAMARGSGKTTIAECTCLWAMLGGHHHFVLLVGPTKDHAKNLIDAIKDELVGNEELAADFPEACFPLVCLEDRANRCKGQHTCGARTKPAWGIDRIVLPTVEGSRASGAILRVAGLTGSIRGMKKDSLRPSLCILDDPQTDRSANSPSQCEKRERLVNGAVLGLAGPGQPITVIMPCTIIRQGDLAARFLDRERNPLWTGRRWQLLYQLPANMGLWDQYAVMRADEFRNDGDGSQATAFYAEHRAVMDEGAVVAWPERKKPNELSGVQHAMNLLYADRWSFWAEYQNAPLSEDLGDGQLEAKAVGSRVNGLGRGVVPLGCTHVTAFIDVQKTMLYWLVAAWSEDFTGAILDYGSWPDQQRRYFTVSDAQNTIVRKMQAAGVAVGGIESQLRYALTEFTAELLARNFPREDGATFRVERLLVDAGFWSDTIKAWCRQSPHAAIILPSLGHGVGAKNKPWEEYDASRCEKLGTHWMIPKVDPAKKALRHVAIDTNWFKTFVAARLSQPIGDKGALAIWGKTGQDHRMLADHLTSEYWTETAGRGRKLHEWSMRPGQTENHWWDCLVGAAVAASMAGCAIAGHAGKSGPRKLINVKEEQAKRLAEFEQRRRYGT